MEKRVGYGALLKVKRGCFCLLLEKEAVSRGGGMCIFAEKLAYRNAEQTPDCFKMDTVALSVFPGCSYQMLRTKARIQ